MVLSFHLYQRNRSTQEFQSRIEGNAIARRHVGVGRPMEKQQRCMDFVGIVERTMIDIQLLVGPRIAVGHAHLTVGIAPKSLAPIGSVVADSGMRHGGSEDVGLRLKILGHEATVGSSQTAHMTGIHIVVVGTELPRALNNVLCHSLTGSVDMA